jgi:hypothetical protein
MISVTTRRHLQVIMGRYHSCSHDFQDMECPIPLDFPTDYTPTEPVDVNPRARICSARCRLSMPPCMRLWQCFHEDYQIRISRSLGSLMGSSARELAERTRAANLQILQALIRRFRIRDRLHQRTPTLAIPVSTQCKAR